VCADDGVVDDAVLDLLMSLVDKSLLVADLDRDEPRYALLEPFRQYAREKLSAQHDEQTVLQRQAKVLLALAEELERDFDVEADRVREALQEELDNWRAVLQWTLTERCDELTGLALVGALYLLWKLIPFEGRRWVTIARELIDNAVTPAVRVALDYADGEIAGALREYERMLSSGEWAFAEFRSFGDTLGMARALGLMCAALINFRRFAEAKRLIRKTLSLAKATGNRHVLAYAYRCLAFIIGTDSPVARRCLTKAIQLYEVANDSLLTSSTLCELGGFEVNGGQPEEGLAHLAKALAIDRARNDVFAIVRVCGELALNLVYLKRYEQGEEYAREALSLACRQHLDFEIVMNLYFLVLIAVSRPRGRYTLAFDAYADAARALGYADARLTLIGSSRTEDTQMRYEEVVTALREVIDADRLATLMAEGAAMTEDDAVKAALTSAAASRSPATSEP
jgi:tetratricopeptide (TPR) repeat protein